MTIKEMESKTQMSRANIRYYEAEGLIHPARQENGYRVYSKADAEILLKIKLLRTLGLPLEDIRSLQAGDVSLSDALAAHRNTLALEQTRLQKSKSVTEQLMAAGESFDTLNPVLYLAALESSDAVLKKDVETRLNLPWRRYFARAFDYVLYSTLINSFLFRQTLNDFLSYLLPLIAMVLLEPLLLHLFATTPGKAIFGIRVTDMEGGKLRYGDALERSWLVLWEGEGLRIPLVTYYFLYRSYTKAENGEALPWETDSDLTILDDGKWRYGLFLGMNFILLVLDVLFLMYIGGLL